MTSSNNWWACGRMVYVADTYENRIDEFRTRHPGRSLCEFGVHTLRIGMHGEIFDERAGPGPGVFATRAEAADFLADYCVKRASQASDRGHAESWQWRECDWRNVAARSRAALARAEARRGK